MDLGWHTPSILRITPNPLPHTHTPNHHRGDDSDLTKENHGTLDRHITQTTAPLNSHWRHWQITQYDWSIKIELEVSLHFCSMRLPSLVLNHGIWLSLNRYP
jgi:hypothetical protein